MISNKKFLVSLIKMGLVKFTTAVVDITGVIFLYSRQDEVGVYISKNELLYPRRQLSVKISIDDQKNID